MNGNSYTARGMASTTSLPRIRKHETDASNPGNADAGRPLEMTVVTVTEIETLIEASDGDQGLHTEAPALLAGIWRDDRAWDRDRGDRHDRGDRGMPRRDSRREGDDRPPRRDRDLFEGRGDRGRGGGRPARSDRDEFAMQMAGRDRKKSASPPPKKKEPTPDLTDTIPITERKRRLTQWDIKPPGYENVTAEQAKLSGMFPLPGAPRQQPMDPSRLQAFMNQPSGSAGNAALKPSNARQSKRLFVHNIPATANEEAIVNFFNLQMNGLNVVEGTDPCISAQISQDRTFALCEFKTPAETTVALALDGITMEDNDSMDYTNGTSDTTSHGLSVRRPKDYIVPSSVEDTAEQEGIVSPVVPDTPNKISVTNLLLNLTEDQVTELLVSFGQLKAFVLVKDRSTEESRGIAFCEYTDPAVTDIAVEGLNGMELGDKLLKVQRASIGVTQAAGLEMGVNAMSMLAGTTSTDLDEGRVLQLLNMVTAEELIDNEDYNEICEDVKEECEKYGEILEMKIPRPSGGSRQSNGVGKIFVKYDNADSARKALQALAGRKFADRTVVTTYFSEENFEVNACRISASSLVKMSDADFAEVKRLQQERNAQTAGKKGSKTFDPSNQRTDVSTKASLTESFDTDLYSRNGVDKFAGYNTEIAVDGDDDMPDGDDHSRRLVGQYTATKDQMNEFARGTGVEEEDILLGREKQARIADRETDYQKRRHNRGPLTPTRADPFAANRQASVEDEGQSYREVMAAREIEKEEARVQRIIEEKQAKGENGIVHHEPTLKKEDSSDKENREAGSTVAVASGRKRKQRWDVTAESTPAPEDSKLTEVKTKRSRWDQTPVPGSAIPDATPKRSRWDQAPSLTDATPVGQSGLATPMHPSQGLAAMAPTTFGTDISSRNAPLSDEELDMMLPSEGYKILDPPPGYAPIRTPARKLMSTPAPMASSSGIGGFMMQEPENARAMGKQLPTEIPGVGDLQFFKAEDMAYFGKLVDGQDENEMSVEELKERKIMRLLLKVKNGTPPMRKTALRQLTDNARQFGAGPLFNQILPLLMEKTLEDQERHLLVKVIDRVLYKLDDLVRPYVHKILVVIEPLLIDQDYYARVEGREIISNLSKAAGLAHMISTMRPDIDHVDEYVRNTTARAFAVVASALGIPALLPFLRAVCRSKKSWQARHTGVKIVQQIPILMGCAILPHLKGLVDCIGDNLSDEQAKVRTVTSLAIAALAEAANPYGIESFDDILNPLWSGARLVTLSSFYLFTTNTCLRKQRGKGLAGFLKAVGYIIPLMDEEYANYYTSQIMEILLREFSSPDEEMKKVVLKVVSQCAGTDGVTAGYLKEHVLSEFFKSFWVRRMALDKRNYRQVVETTVDLGQKVGVSEIVERIVNNLKDESEAYRKMTLETVEKVIASLGAADIGERLEERLIDGVLHSFQEQSVEDIVMLNGFGTVVNALGTRCKPYLPQIVSTILWRLNNKSATVRQQAADLISRIAIVMKQCGEDALMGKLGVVLYEYLGEEYPEVLGSILGALRSIVTVVGINSMQPPIKDLLPRLTPILRNRHEKVQENTIDLVGRIADRGPESVNAREWMRICFELLDMLKAHKKGIRRAANNTFGFIAKAIGPQDVLATLLNNLRVQERQSRVCTAVAIGIVAETCAPFTVLPALMNEYRVPELNVQNGVLKSLSFLFEYIGEMAKDYVYAVTPLLEDALIDRDQVHRQTAASVVKHVALGVVGLGCEDAMMHLLNLLYPNIFETSPHVIDRIIEAIDAVRMAVGTGLVMNYVWAGLFHPARKVRTPYF
ncbi:MAG: hypothetical protein Q9218_005477, partial [Villophora microphyllina]